MVTWYLMLRSIRCCLVRTTVPVCLTYTDRNNAPIQWLDAHPSLQPKHTLINGWIDSIVSTASKGETINAKLYFNSLCDMPKYPYIKQHPCVVETISDIKAGDEIIIDYGWKDKSLLDLLKDYSNPRMVWSENTFKYHKK